MLSLIRNLASLINNRSISLKRDAFKEHDIAASKKLHRSHNHEDHHLDNAQYLSDFVLGGIDGIITTFAVVSGVVGAKLSAGVILILGLANLFADGFSMATGNYLGTKSENDFFRSERRREEWEVENLPEHEEAEIREIFERKNFSGKLLDDIVAHITADKKLWVDTMMREELGIIEDQKSPFMVGLTTFLAFVFFGSIPLITYVTAFISGNHDVTIVHFWQSVGSTGIALFAVGVMRSRFTFEPWFRSGLEILFVGGAAGTVAYLVGASLSSLG
ncbi:MAG: VIT1/CCC1 transporter family protein [Bdellovibrionales bacterium]|nr:VIT1/CCC1 transporter family protein [Bdellovibrionales bacterium]